MDRRRSLDPAATGPAAATRPAFLRVPARCGRGYSFPRRRACPSPRPDPVRRSGGGCRSRRGACRRRRSACRSRRNACQRRRNACQRRRNACQRRRVETLFEALFKALETVVDVPAQRSDHGYDQRGQRYEHAGDHDRNRFHGVDSDGLPPMRFPHGRAHANRPAGRRPRRSRAGTGPEEIRG